MSTIRRETFDVGDRASIDLVVKSGAIDVRLGESGQVTVELDGQDVDEWVVSQLGDTVTVDPGRRRDWRVRSVRLLVHVPAGTNVSAKAASADVVLVGELGTVRAHTASGDVRIATATRLEVRTASGDAAATEVATNADCSTVSGDVDVGRVGGRLNISTASGDVRVALAADDVEIGSASGNVRIDRYDGTDISVKCISGDVSLGLPSGIRVEPDISTLSGRTRLPEPATSASPASEPRRVVRVGLRTVSGDIAIRRV